MMQVLTLTRDGTPSQFHASLCLSTLERKWLQQKTLLGSDVTAASRSARAAYIADTETR